MRSLQKVSYFSILQADIHREFCVRKGEILVVCLSLYYISVINSLSCAGDKSLNLQVSNSTFTFFFFFTFLFEVLLLPLSKAAVTFFFVF